jgi:hypothetical protein
LKNIEDKILALNSIFFLTPGADDLEINRFLKDCEEKLSVNPPVEYLKLLKTYNGIAGNGVFLYSTYRKPFEACEGENNDFVEMNLSWRDLEWMSDYLIFGDSDMDIYVLEITTGKYQVRDRQAFDNLFNEFSTFEGLLEHVINQIANE